MQANLIDTDLKVDGEHLRLGLNSLREGGECGAVQSGEEEFTILTWLTECGTKLSVSTTSFEMQILVLANVPC